MARRRKNPNDPKWKEIDAERKKKMEQIAQDNVEVITTPGSSLNGLMKGNTAYYPDVEDDLNHRMIAMLQQTQIIAQQADKNNPDTFYDCLDQYLNLCKMLNLNVTNMNAYAACGLTRFDIRDWLAGIRRKHDPRYKQFALHITRICSQYRETMMAEGKLSPITGIWWQKNYDHFEDQPKYLLPESDDHDELTSAEIAEKYKNIPDE